MVTAATHSLIFGFVSFAVVFILLGSVMVFYQRSVDKKFGVVRYCDKIRNERSDDEEVGDEEKKVRRRKIGQEAAKKEDETTAVKKKTKKLVKSTKKQD